jgi:hypothetical protein
MDDDNSGVSYPEEDVWRDNLLGVDITLNEDFTFTVTKGNQVNFAFFPFTL